MKLGNIFCGMSSLSLMVSYFWLIKSKMRVHLFDVTLISSKYQWSYKEKRRKYKLGIWQHQFWKHMLFSLRSTQMWKWERVNLLNFVPSMSNFQASFQPSTQCLLVQTSQELHHGNKCSSQSIILIVSLILAWATREILVYWTWASMLDEWLQFVQGWCLIQKNHEL